MIFIIVGLITNLMSIIINNRASLVAQTVKHLPTIWETQIQSLSQEDLLEKEMETHSSILAWKILWMEEPGRLQSVWLQKVGHDWATLKKNASYNEQLYV